jgi:hypothetical protein
LALVYAVAPGQSITKTDLNKFRSQTLEYDDIFQPAFYDNVVLHGASKEDVQIATGAYDELLSWGVKIHTFVSGDQGASVPPGPYVFADGKTWQPWRVYYDHNACFMTAFRLAEKVGGR